jgi:hypothetical protein
MLKVAGEKLFCRGIPGSVLPSAETKPIRGGVTNRYRWVASFMHRWSGRRARFARGEQLSQEEFRAKVSTAPSASQANRFLAASGVKGLALPQSSRTANSFASSLEVGLVVWLLVGWEGYLVEPRVWIDSRHLASGGGAGF